MCFNLVPRLLSHDPQLLLTEGLMGGGKLADGSSFSRGCGRAGPDVRQAARMRMPAWGFGPRGAVGGGRRAS
jgi:hypothetical protein